MGWTDANVVDVLTVANQGEVDYSQIAVDKATDPSVKAYAQLMVKEHGAMVTSVKDLAARLAVTPAANDKNGSGAPCCRASRAPNSNAASRTYRSRPEGAVWVTRRRG